MLEDGHVSLEKWKSIEVPMNGVLPLGMNQLMAMDLKITRLLSMMEGVGPLRPIMKDQDVQVGAGLKSEAELLRQISEKDQQLLDLERRMASLGEHVKMRLTEVTELLGLEIV
jgi:hypothetical protein